MSVASTGRIRNRTSLEGAARPVTGASLSNVRLAFVPLPVFLLLTAMLVPGELDFYLGALRLSCHRMVLLVFFPIILVRIAAGHGPSWRMFDAAFIGAFLYYALTMPFKVELGQAVQSGGIIFVEGAGGYLMARMYVRNAYQFLATAKLLFLLALIAGGLALAEIVLSQSVAHVVASSISGVPQIESAGLRFGLLRAMSVFDHPILYGAFCMSVFGLVWFAEPNVPKRLLRASLVAGAAALSLSSAPIIGIFVVCAGIVWERVTRRIPNRAWLSIAAVGVVYLMLSLLATRSPLKIVAITMAFDPSTAWYRTLIWEFGVDNVLNHPWIGQPLGVWSRPAWMPAETVDNFWLATALWGGLPASVLIGLGVVLMMRAVHWHASRQSEELRRCRFAWTATVLSLCLVGATVHYWNTMAVLFSFLVGLGAWLAEPQKNSDRLARGLTRPRSNFP